MATQVLTVNVIGMRVEIDADSPESALIAFQNAWSELAVNVAGTDVVFDVGVLTVAE